MTRIRQSKHLGTTQFTDLANNTTVSAAAVIAGAAGGSTAVQSVTATASAAIAVAGTATDPTVGVIPAAFVANADPTSLATLATSIDALRDSLITANLMAAS